MNITLFISTVLIWGTTWYAIALQLGDITVIQSVFHRFALSGIIFLLGLLVLGRLKIPTMAEQKWIIAQAFCLFSLNFIMFYNATSYIPSGLVAVVFSLATIFNAINAKIWFGDKMLQRTILAGAVGLSGVCLLFFEDIALGANLATLKGLAFAAIGTMLFSLGNMVSRRNSASGLDPIKANSWGMVYGAAILLVIVGFEGEQLALPTNATYLWALLYLAVIGSVVGFTAYLTLVARIGSAKAAYATVLFPVVALAISTMFEGFSWSTMNLIGLMLALLGNIIMFMPGKTLVNGLKPIKD